MKRFLNSQSLILSLLAILVPAWSLAEEPEKTDKPRFIRVYRNAETNEMESLDTAIARYESPAKKGKEPVVVDLIGAVHIGEKDYYKRLDKKFQEYDVLLYELVAPKGTRVPADGKREGGNPLSALQGFMKDALQLEFQLEQIDYQAKNFVHADMSPDEFLASMKKLDESPMKMFFKLMRASLAQQAEKGPPVNDALLLAALFDRKNGPMILKRVLAQELGGSDIMLEALNGPDGSTIVTERNKVALKVMQEQIDAGKKKIGIFYGAAHLADMHERMLRDHKLKAGKITWEKAWDLTLEVPEKVEEEK